MERPKNLKGAGLKYVQYLEEKLEIFSSKKTAVRTYLARKKIIDDINNLIMRGIEVDNPETQDVVNVDIISDMSLMNKDDKSFDRILKVIDKQGVYSSELTRMESVLTPEEIDTEKEILKGELSVEAIIFNRDNG